MLPRIPQSAHNARQVASQQHLHLILAILSKRVSTRGSAAASKRNPPLFTRSLWHDKQY
jgi:hypothetical protein